MSVPSLLTPHHLALKVRNLEVMEEFYQKVLGLRKVTEHFNEEGRRRSVWLESGDLTVMLEKAEGDFESSHLMAFAIPLEKRVEWKNYLHKHQISLLKESPYSLFINDPEGNRLALSHYPESSKSFT